MILRRERRDYVITIQKFNKMQSLSGSLFLPFTAIKAMPFTVEDNGHKLKL